MRDNNKKGNKATDKKRKNNLKNSPTQSLKNSYRQKIIPHRGRNGDPKQIVKYKFIRSSSHA